MELLVPGLPYRPLVHVNQGNLSVHTNVSESTYTDSTDPLPGDMCCRNAAMMFPIRDT